MQRDRWGTLKFNIKARATRPVVHGNRAGLVHKHIQTERRNVVRERGGDRKLGPGEGD